jgi:hypothetical protein
MAGVSTLVKQSFLRKFYRASLRDGSSLLQILEAAEDARVDSVSRGKVLIATSGNGHTDTFQIPSDLSPTDILELVSELRRRYDEAASKGSDRAIYNEMMSQLQPVFSIANDFSGLRSFQEEPTP